MKQKLNLKPVIKRKIKNMKSQMTSLPTLSLGHDGETTSDEGFDLSMFERYEQFNDTLEEYNIRQQQTLVNKFELSPN